MVNATRTTLWEELWRWGRRTARALLLTGALAGMTLGSVAYAQITFRNASSAAALQAPAAPTASPGTTSTITFVGDARMPATDNANAAATNATITPPGGMATNDYVVVYVAARTTAVTITNPTTGGQTWTAGTDTELNGISFRIFHSRFNGTWSANPNFAWTNSVPYQVWMVVFRGVDTTTAIDAGPNIAAFAAPASPFDVTIPATTITTASANAMVIASWHSIDNNTWGLQTAGWLNPNNQTQWRNAGGNDSSSSIGYQVQPTAGGNAAVTSRQTAVGGDAGIRSILALRPARNVLTITQPSGTVSGDVLFASIGFRPSCCDQPAANYGITPQDAGWTLLRRLDNAPGAGVVPSNSLAVYWKVAGAAEPAAYRWSFSVTAPTTFDAAAGGILKFSGVEAVTPTIGVEENGRQTTAGDQTTPSITTTAANTMLVTSHSYASPTTAPWTAPSGMTSLAAVDVKAGGQSTAIFYGVQAIAGPTGTKRAIPTPDDDRGNAHILALRSATAGTALTIPIPQGTVANDVMIAAITVRGADRTITPPAAPFDWAEVRRTEQTAGTANLQVFYARAAGASEPASYTWTLASTHTGAVGGILSFSGVDTTAPILTNAIDNHGGNLSPGTGGAITANSINTNVANTVAVSAHSFVSSANWSPAAPVDVPSRRVPNGVGISLGMYHYPAQTLPGATGDKTATATNDADTGIGQILALKPPPPAPAVGGFNAYETSTAAGATTGVIRTKIAGSTVGLDIIALNAAKTAIATGFTGTVRVEVLNSSNNTGALDANGCRPTWTVIQTLSPDPAFVAGDNGRKTISFTQANSFPNARLRITFPAGAPTVTGCSNDNFAIRPNTLASFAVTDTDWQTAGTGRALSDVTFGSVTHKAGRPLSVRATALNAAGTPATTTNYTGAPTATLTACAGAACTATFGTLTLTTTFVLGQLTSDVASYNNVGSFRVELVDSSFASVDAGDSSALEREIRSGTIDVGRFVPDHFAVALNAPVFGTACGAGGFTYIGQAFNYTTAPAITVTAQGFANNTTTLYAGAWSRITNSTVTPATQAARYSRFDALGGGTTPGLDPSGLPLPAGDPAIGVFISGVGALTFSSGTGLGFVRSTTIPNAPFNADIALALNVIDTDAVAYAGNPAAFGTATSGGGMAFSGGTGMRFGRLRLNNALGSSLLDLPLPLSTQYYDGNFFVTNTADSCTTLAANNVRMAFVVLTPNNLVACETALSPTGTIYFNAGRASAIAPPSAVSAPKLTKPGIGNNGAVDLTVNLNGGSGGNTCTPGSAAVTNANKPWLQGNWGTGSYNDDPRGRATFGIFKNADQFLYFREVY